jgi:FkbM family methyltransferase
MKRVPTKPDSTGSLALEGVAGSIARKLLRMTIQRAPLSRRNRQRLYNLVAPHVASSVDVECSVRVRSGLTVKMTLRLDDWVNSQLYYWGYEGYEVGVTRLLRRLLPSRRCVLDVGANVGYYTVLAAALAPAAEVHAFEPWPLLFARLERNVRMNGFAHVRLNNTAAADRNGSATLYLPAASPGDPHLSNASLLPGFTTQDATLPVTATRLDTYCSGRAARPVDLIKIDAEGAELSVLRGMGDVLTRCRPDLVLEVLEGYAEELDDFVSNVGYRKFLITLDGLLEVERLVAHPRLRDYYLTTTPPPNLWAGGVKE